MRNISLITDLGTSDHYAALLKSLILKSSASIESAEEIRFIDVSHKVASHDIQEAAYLLRSILDSCTKGTIHIVAVYNYYSSQSEFVLFEYEGQYFIGPNNGIFSLLFEDIDDAHIYQIQLESQKRLNAFEYFAHAVSIVLSGLEVSHAGLPVTNFERKLEIMPVITNMEIRATIIYVDQFENVILNLTKEFFEQQRRGREFKLFFQHQDPITLISNFYSDVSIGEVVCFFNQADHMEIAINMGKASSMLDLHKNKTVQINFEDD